MPTRHVKSSTVFACLLSTAAFVGCADPASSIDAVTGGDLPRSGSQSPGRQSPGRPLANVPASSHAAFLWQGMEHRWLRSVMGFAVPHRIAFLESSVGDEANGSEHDDGALFAFGQGTGVDGNHMQPVGLWAAFESPSVVALRGTHEFSGTDAVVKALYPRAETQASATVDMALPVGVDAERATVTGVLQGFTLETKCDPKKQPDGSPCNSDGAWPVALAFGVEGCAIADRKVTCRVSFRFDRAWTPTNGGVPGIEEKPLNERLDYRFNVKILAVVGKSADFAVSEDVVSLVGAIHDQEPRVATRTVGVSASASAATVGFSHLGFELYRTQADASANHLGRYIGALNFGLRNAAYDSNQGKFVYDVGLQVWAPNTVRASGVSYEAKTQVLQFRTGSVTHGSAKGALCLNSAGAPTFSAWQQCGKGGLVAERRRDEVRVP
jgi:hypothetical protein